MSFKFLTIIFLLVGCSHIEEKYDETPQSILNDLRDKQIIVVAPGSPCSETSMQKIEKHVSHNQNIRLVEYTDDYSAKATVLKQALLNSEHDIIWALRGGSGTAKVVDMLYDDTNFMSKMRIKTNHPLVIGYSDITAWHLFLSQEFGWKTVHGSLFYEIFLSDKNREENFGVLNKLINGVSKITINGLKPINEIAKEQMEIRGQITGGNLSVIQTSIGTRWQIDCKNKILFLEDLNEKPYRVDRMLYHLKSAGVFDSVKAIILCNLCDQTKQMEKMIANFASNMHIPIYKTNVLGHGTYNYPIVYNSDVKIRLINDNISLTQNF